MSRTALRICPICEATCGLVLTIDDAGRVDSARGDRDDVFSHGFICPKGASFPELDNDPDRLDGPLIRRDGELVEVGWDEAFAAAAEGLQRVIGAAGDPRWRCTSATPTRTTSPGRSTARQSSNRWAPARSTRPAHWTRCPSTSPADTCTATWWRSRSPTWIAPTIWSSSAETVGVQRKSGHRRRLRRQARRCARGGRLVVIDPSRTRTAELADRQYRAAAGYRRGAAVRDRPRALRRGSRRPRPLADHVTGVERVRAAAADFLPDAVAEHVGVAADEIRTLAREIAGPPALPCTAGSAPRPSSSGR